MSDSHNPARWVLSLEPHSPFTGDGPLEMSFIAHYFQCYQDYAAVNCVKKVRNVKDGFVHILSCCLFPLAFEQRLEDPQTSASDVMSQTGNLQPAIQAGGHLGAKSGNGVFVKPTNSTELDFYNEMVVRDSPILDISPMYMGTLQPQEEGAKPCVVLGDLLHEFINPSVLDIKLGSVLWDHNADDAKVERLSKVAESTTTGSLGFRITGMSVVQENGQRKVYDKQYGREGCDALNVGDRLKAFFPVVNEYTLAVKDVLTKHLDNIRDIVSEQPVEMHSASVLLVYEGDMAALKRKVDSQDEPPLGQGDAQGNIDQCSSPQSSSDSSISPKDAIVVAKLIDFGHAFFVDEPYPDLVNGLSNFVDEWRRMVL